MKLAIILDILLELLAKRKVTAAYLSEKHDISMRTVYRYIDLLSNAVPLTIKRGRGGGVYLSDGYKLPVDFFSKEEYDCLISALNSAYAESLDEQFLLVKRKLTAQESRAEHQRELSGEMGTLCIENEHPSPHFADKLALLNDCIKEKILLEVHLGKEKNAYRRLEPHLLLLHKGIWKLYAFCHTTRNFQQFNVGDFYSIMKSEEHFSPRPFQRETLPNHTQSQEKMVDVVLQIEPRALPRASALFGVENLKMQGDVWKTKLSLPDDEELVLTVLRYGEGITLLSPLQVKNRIAMYANTLAKIYNPQE